MKFKGKVYAKINGRYIECTQTIEDLENEIKDLKQQVKNLNKHFVRRSAETPPKPRQGDYYETRTEGDLPSTRVPSMTWKEEYEMDLDLWNRHYA